MKLELDLPAPLLAEARRAAQRRGISVDGLLEEGLRLALAERTDRSGAGFGLRDAKRRPGRPLAHEELDHLRSIIHRIAALLRLHPRFDQCYEQAIEDPFTTEDLGL